MKNLEKGITLIALAITIIVLLILAGVTISIAMRTGIMDKAEKSVDLYTEQEVLEEVKLDLLDYKTDNLLGKDDRNLQTFLTEKYGSADEAADPKYYEITVKDYIFWVNKSTLEVISQGLATGPVPTIDNVEEELLADNTYAQVIVTASPVNGGNLTITINGDNVEKIDEKTNETKFRITKNGTYTIVVKEDNVERKAIQQLKIDELIEKYTVTLTKDVGIESATINGEESVVIEKGQNLPITSTIKSSYLFDKWEITSGTGTLGDATSASTTITPTSNITIKAISKTPLIANGNNLTVNEKSTNGTLTEKAYSYNNPVVPVGFKTSNEGASWEVSTDGATVQGWNDGLVIEDKDGNQFVWVPVDGINVKYDYHYNVNGSGSSDTEKDLPDGITNETNQIDIYHGFYIGRYEAGIPTDDPNLTTGLTTANVSARDKEGKPVSKKNQVAWNYISWTNSQRNAQSMYKFANTNNHVQSVLLTDRMWETTCKWLEKSETNVTSDCTSWGNCSDSVSPANVSGYGNLQRTGFSDKWQKKNIYDLAGNLWEFTNAKWSSYYQYATRGCAYNRSGTSYGAAFRAQSEDRGFDNQGFRVGLYIQ